MRLLGLLRGGIGSGGGLLLSCGFGRGSVGRGCGLIVGGGTFWTVRDEVKIPGSEVACKRNVIEEVSWIGIGGLTAGVMFTRLLV